MTVACQRGGCIVTRGWSECRWFLLLYAGMRGGVVDPIVVAAGTALVSAMATDVMAAGSGQCGGVVAGAVAAVMGVLRT